MLERIRYYKEAARIIKVSLEEEKRNIKPNTRILDIAERIEQRIIEEGGKPAFPVNISINEVAAHYSPSLNDETVIKPRDVVKVDIGAHVNGYIIDSAWTFNFNSNLKELVEAASLALEKAVDTVKAKVRSGKIGEVIEETIKSKGFKPVQNLSGHLLKRYSLHGGKSIPNVKTFFSHRLKENEVYAIEPFATVGKGYVKETRKYLIFRLVKKMEPRSKLEEKVLNYIRSSYNFLPFALRWLEKEFEPQLLDLVLKDLVKRGAVERYGVLVEAGKGVVAQRETTVMVTKQGCVRFI